MATSEIAKLESRWRENPQGLTFAPLAEAYRKLKDPVRALEILQPGLERHPDYIPANIVLGRCHWDLDDLPASERAFSHVLGLDSENVIALKALADIAERRSRFDEAERWLEALLSVDRSNDEAREQLARVRTRQSEQGSVVPAPESAVALEPASLDAPAISESAPAAADYGASEAAADAGESAAPFFPEVETADVPFESELPGIAPDEQASVPPKGADTSGYGFEGGFGVERSEDIVLRASSRSEFQPPNAADDLMQTARAHGDALMPAPYAPPVSECTSESALEPAAGSRLAADEPMTPLAAHDATEAAAPASSPAHADHPAEPELVVTETMAEVFLRQGHVTDALLVYRELGRRSPGDVTIQARIAELEEREAAHRPVRRAYAAQETGGRSLAGLLQSLLAARPAPVAGPRWSQPAAPDGASAAAVVSGGSAPREPEGAPTRPAGDPLSLGSVFGEEPPAALPAMPVEGPGKAAAGVSFDEFFGAPRPSGATPVRQSPAPRGQRDDDLDQFHAWLQGLKR